MHHYYGDQLTGKCEKHENVIPADNCVKTISSRMWIRSESESFSDLSGKKQLVHCTRLLRVCRTQQEGEFTANRSMAVRWCFKFCTAAETYRGMTKGDIPTKTCDLGPQI